MNKPNFSYEEELWNGGIYSVIGVDEVGRGALAGPVVAGAAVLKTKFQKKSKNQISKKIQKPNSRINKILELGIDDSKRLTSRQREQIAREIPKYFLTGTGEASTSEINRMGIVRATSRAMRRAIWKIRNPESPDLFGAGEIQINFKIQNPDTKQNPSKFTLRNYFLLVDGRQVKYMPGGKGRQRAIIKGDQKSISIAAASIMAKVYRDRLMRKLSRQFRRYNWEQNKGYGTGIHRRAILEFGVCRLHRRVFVD